MTNESVIDALYKAAEEMEDLRRRLQNEILVRKNLTLRIAIHQINGGSIEYKHYEPGEWEKIVQLIEDCRLGMCHDGKVLLDGALLTREILRKE